MPALRHALVVIIMGILAGACVAERTVVTSVPYSPVRSGPGMSFSRITELEEGVPLWAETKVGGWYRVRLHEGLVGWAHSASVTPQPDEVPPPRPQITDIAVAPHERGVRVTVMMTGKAPYRVRQLLGASRLKLDLFGARLAAYGLRCLPIEPFLASVQAEQVRAGWAEITFDLDMSRQTGHAIHYAGPGRLVLDIRGPPKSPGLAGKVIALDPGHGGHDPGAMGPTGLFEKDVNLTIALALRDMLTQAGATVVMKRDRDIALRPPEATQRAELIARVVASRAAWPDIFLSIHNNHLGHGDAAAVAGTETYYHTPMSAQPAWTIHKALCERLGTQSRRVARRSFCVLRETEAPRVLVECAYISHPDEEALLADDAFLHRAAEGLRSGLEMHFAEVVTTGERAESGVIDLAGRLRGLTRMR